LKRHTLFRIADVMLIGLLAVYVLAGTPIAPFHGDESTQIYMSRDYAYQFLQGDLTLVRYSDPPISPPEQWLRLINGTVPKYLFGLAWHLAGFQVSDINEQWDWGADWDYNISRGYAPSEALLQATRIPSAVMLALGLIPMFALGKRIGGRPAAYLACLYYALSPQLLINGRRAMMEGALTTFSLLVVWAGVLFISGKRYRVGRVLFLGIAAGLAIASKHTAIFTVGAVFAVCALYPRLSWSRKATDEDARSSNYGSLIAAGVLAFGVFFALNPAWWDSPFSRSFQVLRLRNELLSLQVDQYGGYSDFGDQIGGFFRHVFIAQPQYYEVPVWQDYVADQIARYEATIWRGVAIGGSMIGGVIVLGLCVIGGGALARDKTRDLGVRLIILTWAGIMVLSTMLLSPLDWGRYYLPVLPAVGLLGAVGVIALVIRAVGWGKKGAYTVLLRNFGI
jgi:4-amino-4-deoxy-L-arabinose transferase-like glycosyltransferase